MQESFTSSTNWGQSLAAAVAAAAHGKEGQCGTVTMVYALDQSLSGHVVVSSKCLTSWEAALLRLSHYCLQAQQAGHQALLPKSPYAIWGWGRL